MKVIILADLHVGADLWGTAPEKWDAPFREAIVWGMENGAKVIVIAGDLFHKRHPTPEEYVRVWRLIQQAIDCRLRVIVVPGNHDMPAVGTVNALWPLNRTSFPGEVRTSVDVLYAEGGLNILTLPWPRIADYRTWGDGESLSVEDQIAACRQRVLDDLRGAAAELNIGRGPTERLPSILVGHAMVAYGDVKAQDPGLILGRDIVLPYADLEALPHIDGIFLGHVHDSTAKGYVGSSQPTDLSDTGPKSFTVFDTQTRKAEKIRYRSSLTVADINLELEPGQDIERAMGAAMPAARVDVMRLRVTRAASTVTPDTLRKIALRYTDKLIGPEVAREALVERRTAVGEPSIAAMDPREAFRRWLDLKGMNGRAETIAPVFDALVVHSAK